MSAKIVFENERIGFLRRRKNPIFLLNSPRKWTWVARG